ncbi:MULTISPECIES: flavin reductase family protein [unclassified Oceanobacter]|jgi:flavin reductase (DIM6/NTAB) family NADH-FMN oxidoreductase RutF|uniref:flavin reductase family protein n=1 Tax=unclassified Oceanobacter TaxID=2620260 RepID=UPI0027374DC2|nr:MULTISPECIES: flavin reductase family protein [unclassified Oceanobacter]MDP2505158.1 flavin reductase family protein [Oceanobacter sp. 3_MG-2023]MDP2549169.1 flavin reductase family protein [Oceanobacter sp. 4_MG-2023]MDP2610172.1 flavin reductase family protein [Oceanobacter sp. 1_MG-2023]MDP2613419.1 flavin reductase family protein [Oceanobacter sp. 2_MG-2023]
METLIKTGLLSASDADSRTLRTLFGQFATGVTIITTMAADDTPVGLTANSFSSVSLDPALVLWSLDKRSPNLELFRHIEHFAINILGADQEDLSNRFARPSDDKFEDVDYYRCDNGTAVLDGALATLVCRNERQIDAGDHLIFIGEIHHYSLAGGQPLLFHGGQYQSLAQTCSA